MTVFYYIIIAILSALMLAGGACAIFRAGERDGIANYNYTGDETK